VAAVANRQPWDDELKAQAKALYAADGATLASAATGIPSRTIRRWAMAEQWPQPGDGHRPDLHVAGAAPVPSAPEVPANGAVGHGRGWQPRLLLERLCAELWAELDTLAALRERGKAREARDTAVVVGILVDKAAGLAKQTGASGGQLDQAATLARLRELAQAWRERKAAG
jgi:hypothetical protein